MTVDTVAQDFAEFRPRLLGIAELEEREELGAGHQEGEHGIVEKLGAGSRLELPGAEQPVRFFD